MARAHALKGHLSHKGARALSTACTQGNSTSRCLGTVPGLTHQTQARARKLTRCRFARHAAAPRVNQLANYAQPLRGTNADDQLPTIPTMHYRPRSPTNQPTALNPSPAIPHHPTNQPPPTTWHECTRHPRVNQLASYAQPRRGTNANDQLPTIPIPMPMPIPIPPPAPLGSIPHPAPAQPFRHATNPHFAATPPRNHHARSMPGARTAVRQWEMLYPRRATHAFLAPTRSAVRKSSPHHVALRPTPRPHVRTRPVYSCFLRIRSERQRCHGLEKTLRKGQRWSV